VYFLAFIPPNYTTLPVNSPDEIQSFLSGDEYVLYPVVLHMLEFGRDIHETWGRLIIYGDYHYGYPYFLLSFLALLPLRLAYGADFVWRPQLNLLILRQVVSILPMILSAGFLVYLVTRFRSVVYSAVLFAFLLLMPAVVGNNLWFWHPDALAVLAVVLTLFFLDRDRLRFGRNFYLAAAACGMASAIKLQGFFFFLTILAYLAAGLIYKKVRLSRAALASAGFIAVMAATIVLSNPFLFYASQRQKLIAIQTYKQTELDKGYTHDDPAAYAKSPLAWQWTLERWYAPIPLLGFLSLVLILSFFFTERKGLYGLFLAWCIPLSLYLLFFVAVKPGHYWLPVMLPLYSAGFALLSPLFNRYNAAPTRQRKLLFAIAIAFIALLLGIILFQSAIKDAALWNQFYQLQKSL
jgi:hypothetical protein